MMKIRILIGMCLTVMSCSSQKFSYENGDLVKIKHGKDVFRIDSAQYRKPKAYANWNSNFYSVTNLMNGKTFSLPQQSLELFEKNKKQPVERHDVLAQSKTKN